MFARSLGSAVGVAVFGAIANTIFGEGDVHSLGAQTVQAGTAAVFFGVLAVAVFGLSRWRRCRGRHRREYRTTPSRPSAYAASSALSG